MEVITISVLYFIAVAIYFLPLPIPCKLALPVALLFIASFKLLPWQMTFAMFFSCLGDYMGAMGNFMGQMGAFALAHVFLILYFLSRYRLGVERRKYGRLSTRYKIAATILVLPLVIFALVKIFPHVPEGVMSCGVLIYALLISFMLWCALQQRSKVFALGGALFLASDMILAWNRFVEHIPHATYYILVPYFLSQWLLFIRSTKWWGRHMEKE
jgi:uncharacterized membrane protein YhhN